MDKLQIISELKDRKCQLEDFDFNEVSECNKLTFRTQNEIACYVTSILEKHKLQNSSDLIQATRCLREDFLLDVLSEGEQGMTFRVTLKGYDKPFAVMKISTEIVPVQQDNIVHEIVIGLILNDMRKFTPNFMFTYGGFICSPPVDRIRIVKQNELDTSFNKIFIIPEKLMDLYFELLEEFGEDEDLPEIDDRSVFIDYLPTLRSIILRLMHKSRTEPSTKLIKQLKNELRAVMNETKMFSKHLSSKNKERDAAKLKEYLLYVNEMLETIAQNEDEIEQKLNELSSSKTSATEQLNLLCSSDDKSVIVLTEFFEGAEELRTFIDGDASRKSKSQVIYQCVLSLIIAHKKLGYMHKDFHPGNILVQKNECTLKYVLDDNVIEFESEYIARIIDYGFSKVEYKGNTIKPIFTSERCNTQYEERQDEPDLKWMRHLISKLSPGTVNQFTVDLLNLETYDEMEEYILSNY